jgi:cell division protein FtsN
MGFFEFIRDNLFIVAIIVAGLINFLGRAGKKEKNKKRQDQPKPVQQRSQTSTHQRMERHRRSISERFEEHMETMTRNVEEKIEDVAHQVTDKANQAKKLTPTEQHQEQLERLRQGMQSRYGQNEELENSHRVMHEQSVNTTNTESKTKETPVHLHLNEQLTTKGLMESVIMAEVLGPPRARNPYQNIAMKRMKR